MKTTILLVLTFLLSISSFSQELIYKSTGRVYNSNNEKLSTLEVQKILKEKPEMLKLYKEGISKKTIGNVLLISGLSFLAIDLGTGLAADVKFPSTLTYAGVAFLVLSIPIKSGHGKKIEKAVDGYNKESQNNSVLNIDKVNIITNKNGIGMRVSF